MGPGNGVNLSGMGRALEEAWGRSGRMTPLQLQLLLDMHSRQLELPELAPTDTHKEQLRELAERWGLALLDGRPRLTTKGKLLVDRLLTQHTAMQLPARRPDVRRLRSHPPLQDVFGHTEADKTCDWSPSRFRRAMPEKQQAEAIRELLESATFAMPPDGDGQTVEISMDAYRKVCAVFPDLVRREG